MTQAISFSANQVTVSSSAVTPILAAGRPKIGIQVKSLAANTALIYIGDPLVSSTRCYPLSPGESLFLPVDNTDQLYALAVVNGEKLHYIVL